MLQTTAVHEIVICDDGSKDDTISIINHFGELYPGIIQLHKNESNLGAKKNFEKAISLSTGDYIFLSDQDDVWLPHKVAATLLFFETNPHAKVVFSNGNMVDNEDKYMPYPVWDSIGFSEEIRNQCSPARLFEFLIITSNIVTGATMCLKKVACSYLFPFFCPDRYWHDYWVALAAAYKNELGFINDRLINYRLHDNQQASLPVINDFYKNQNSLKKMLWSRQYDNACTEQLYNRYIGIRKRYELFAPHIKPLLADTSRIQSLNEYIYLEMDILKRKLFSEIGFFARKKLFLIWLLGRQKTYHLSRLNLVQLLFT